LEKVDGKYLPVSPSMRRLSLQAIALGWSTGYVTSGMPRRLIVAFWAAMRFWRSLVFVVCCMSVSCCEEDGSETPWCIYQRTAAPTGSLMDASSLAHGVNMHSLDGVAGDQWH
jgi:hypothetical protein